MLRAREEYFGFTTRYPCTPSSAMVMIACICSSLDKSPSLSAEIRTSTTCSLKPKTNLYDEVHQECEAHLNH
ncbi:hypothetical protein BDV35DRAFT_347944 [Aspergillus flavus]|uniref:Uncharacterized protein n=1 Tax=Aspergillus flavus TaxID=5059 RepID=A0A5N6H2T0_ASPFL|nr:hypothetical protein BDV35DRAFT_347944 [Aspergillus flavus]